MSDIGIFFQNNCFQTLLELGDLKGDTGLETAVIISLFSDKRVTPSEVPPGLTSQRGWWGDLVPEIEGDQIGSKLWTFSRSKVTLETVAQMETEVKNALNWMLTDGVAESIDVVGSIDEFKRIILAISIKRPSDQQADKFGFAWDGQEVKRFSV